MMKFLNYALLIIMMGLAACSPTAAADTETAVASNKSDTQSTQLSDDYQDALSITGQLAVGTVQLEETDLAVDAAQAAELLPLWQALQALGQSDMAAEAEINAVVNQIQKGMTPAQIETIADMALTSESLTELQSSGALSMGGGRGDRTAGTDSDSASAGRQGGGMAEGGMPGGGPGDGGMPGGGMPTGGEVDEDAMATRQAQMADGSGMQDVMFTSMVVRLLQTKTGETPEFSGRGGNVQDTAVTIISEVTGLSVEAIQAAAADGQTLAEIIAANGGDGTAVQSALAEALAETPFAAGQDLDTFITGLLNGEMGAVPAPPAQE
jgi:hypothetical protein